jgi:hypothetical protein
MERTAKRQKNGRKHKDAVDAVAVRVCVRV